LKDEGTRSDEYSEREIGGVPRRAKLPHPILPHAFTMRSGQIFIDNYGAGGGIELPFRGVGASG